MGACSVDPGAAQTSRTHAEAHTHGFMQTSSSEAIDWHRQSGHDHPAAMPAVASIFWHACVFDYIARCYPFTCAWR